MNFDTSTETLEDISIAEQLVDSPQFVIFNDDVNTFDHVIDTLISVCKHSPEQAEQCTMLVHYKGKCTVKEGDFEKLKPMCESILDKGIQANIQ